MKIAFVTHLDSPEISRSPTSRDDILAQALTKRGMTVVAAPWDDPSVNWRQFDVVILKSAGTYHLRIAEFLQWVENLSSLGIKVFNPVKITAWNCHKSYLFDLQRDGIEIPRTVLIRKETSPLPEVRQVMSDVTRTKHKPVVVKPCVSMAAYETHRVWPEHVEMFQRKFETLVNKTDVLVQEYVEEIETDGEWSLCYFGKEFSHAVRKFPLPGDFRVPIFFQQRMKAAKPNPEIIQFCDKVLSSVPGDVLLARVDVVQRTDAKVVLMELEIIDPRLFFDMDESGNGVNMAVDSLVKYLSQDL